MTRVLDTIELPSGLKTLSLEQLATLAQELRDELIDTVSTSGGHFASSLGATEITVALHHAFNAPYDKIVWDVGHQAYVHKMLTGRREQMGAIRTAGGISGFLRRSESVYDTFGAGHAGTSISAAVGLKVAAPEDTYVISVIGDGSMTAGMAFEAMNHAGALGLKKFIVILNDNEMSISPNVGAISWLFSRAVTSRASHFARRNIKALYAAGYVPELIYRALDKAEEAAQGFFATPAMLFESFGFRYLGPVDGHNIPALLEAIEHAKREEGPVIIHATTVKGKGYEPAEEDPVTWHGVTPFDRSRGIFLAGKSTPAKKIPSYTQVFASALIELAHKNPQIKAITAAMAGGTGLDAFQKEHPDKFYDVGICEQHGVTFAAGLACQEGVRPVCAIYSTFLQRAYDQVVHDVCVQNLPVLFCLDRGGVVGNDGETHQGVFDISFLRSLPHMTVISPKDESELRDMLAFGTTHRGPVAIRYPRGSGFGVEMPEQPRTIELGKAEVLCRGSDALVIAFGPFATRAHYIAAELLAQEGISITVINARFAKPLDTELLAQEIPHYKTIITVEDHALQGGFGSAVLEAVSDLEIPLNGTIKRFGVHDEFVAHGTQEEQYQRNGYDNESIRHYLLSQCRAVGVARSAPLHRVQNAPKSRAVAGT
jgi:1-deoxy-D-xylulose-5-phosphate synthase